MASTRTRPCATESVIVVWLPPSPWPSTDRAHSWVAVLIKKQFRFFEVPANHSVDAGYVGGALAVIVGQNGVSCRF